MSHKTPMVRDYTTRLPIEVDQCDTLAKAYQLMDEHQVRHLPVLSGYHLVGIVSPQDCREAKIRYGDDWNEIKLQDICTRDVFTVSPTAPITEAVQGMLARRIHSAVVVDGDFVVGIFTSADAMRALCDLLGKPPD